MRSENYTLPSENTNKNYFIDQDLRITKERIFIINKAIRDLNLEVRLPGLNCVGRTTECDIPTAPGDIGYELMKSSRGDELWKPRVIMVQKTEIDFTEVKDVQEDSR